MSGFGWNVRTVLVAIGVAGLLPAEGAEMQKTPSKVETIPWEWKPAGPAQPVLVAGAKASSTFMGADGPYAPRLAVDGELGSKWVGADAASPASPQWIAIDLLGTRELTGLALFGETPGNDGVRDAQVQVATAGPDSFVTVAAVEDAKSRSWLATFAPVRTSRVRLLVTRSGGVSTHTDINEIVLLGNPLPPEELRATADQQVQVCSEHAARCVKGLQTFTGAGRELLAADVRAADRVEAAVKDLTARLAGWGTLDERTRQELAGKIERMALNLSRLSGQIEKISGLWAERLQRLQTERQEAGSGGVGAETVFSRSGAEVRLQNRRVLVRLDETTGAWDATWLGPAAVAVRGVRFAVEIDGKTLRPEGVKAETEPVTDKLGRGTRVRQSWGEGVRVERVIRLDDDAPRVIVSGRITNGTDHDITLGTTRLLDVADASGGWWFAGRVLTAPGAVFIRGYSELSCQPIPAEDAAPNTGCGFGGTGVMVLAHDESAAALTVGYLTGLEACPDLNAGFQPAQGGTVLSAQLPFLGRRLARGATLELDAVCLAVHADVYEALEAYAAAVVASSKVPPRRGPNSLWCSWYAHRLAMTEDLVLANAAVAARHFKPLGLEIMQLDHGWQRGDVCGDWVTNERFPHGLPWLSDQLKTRYGLRLGVWIAPSVVAETTDVYREHEAWLCRTADGKPTASYRWFWKPNPQCYTLDSSHPDAQRWIEQTFARLSADGVSYYKIDFLSGGGGKPADPECVPAWGVLRRAMDAIRRGAGQNAWVRYCQMPPLLSVGLADSAYGGCDTSDAGLGGNIEVLRTNVRSLAAGYWINDVLYHREVCDMSVRMQAPIEEVRLRLAMMALAGCSVSFSDEFQYLPPSRIELMQKSLPPGAPVMRPLDLLARAIPSVWHVHCKNDADEWDVVGLFNLESQAEERTVDLARLGIPPGTKAIALEFWEERLLGVCQDRLTLTLPPQTSRIVVLRRLADRPQFLGTNLHLLAGYHELKQLAWDGTRGVLSGRFQRAPGLKGRAYFHVPPGHSPHFDFPLGEKSARLTHVDGNLWVQEIEFKDAQVDWSIPFDGPRKPAPPAPKVEPIQAP